jgi:uncharacterized membrane protein
VALFARHETRHFAGAQCPARQEAGVSDFREESEERIVHRLEAFSDIVFGFSLAQLTFSLVLPSDPLDLFRKSALTLVAFAASFAIVAGMWWSHHRLFAHFFVPTRINIVLNFVSLGGILFMVYALQVWLHATQNRNIGFAMYAGALALVTATDGTLMYRGVLLRGNKMSSFVASRGKWRALRLGLMSAMFTFLAFLSAASATLRVRTGWFTIGAALIILLMRVFERRSPEKGAIAPTPGSDERVT